MAARASQSHCPSAKEPSYQTRAGLVGLVRRGGRMKSEWERPSQLSYGMGGGAEVSAPVQEAVPAKAHRTRRRKA